MATSRRRKRVKQESDDDTAGPLAATSARVATEGASIASAAAAASKRRRLDPSEPVEHTASSSVVTPAVSTSNGTSDRRNRRKRATQQPKRESSEPAQPQAKQESVSEPVEDVAVKLEETPRGNNGLSDASTLAAESNAGELQNHSGTRGSEGHGKSSRPSDVKIEEGSEDEQKPAVPRQYTRAEKGKGRAKDGEDNLELRQEATKLRAELEKLRSELSESRTTAERHQSLLSKVNEALTCNICLETLHHPLALACGHVFCQDDLWNWFHREPEPDAEEDSDSFESFDSQSGDDSSSDESAESDHGTGGQSTATRLGNLPTQTGARQSAHVPGTVARQSNDLVTVEDDYNTDDSFVDTASSKSSSPVAVRGGYRIQTTRGEQVAAYRASLASRRPERQVSATATAPITSAVNGSTSNDVARTARMSEQPLTPGRPLRVPALERPRRKNLVCPQCRSHIALPPFPVFALRGVTDLLAAQTAGRRAQSIEAEREGNNIVDGTWGGLFSTGVRASNRTFPQGRGQNLRQRLGDFGRRGTAQRHGIPDGDSTEDPVLLDHDSAAEDAHSTISSEDIAWLREQVRRADGIRTDDRHGGGRRVALDDLFSSDAPRTTHQDAPGPSYQNAVNGLRRRHETEHLQVNDRTRERNLNELLELRNARRRAHRVVARAHRDLDDSALAEERLREAEDRAIAAVRRELLLSRTERPRQYGRANRNRDVLRHGIRDAEDGVRRCVDCNWEIEAGTCQHCGAVYDSDSEFDSNGDDLNEIPTSPPRTMGEESQLSFIDRSGDSEQDAASYAGERDDKDITSVTEASDSTADAEDLRDDAEANALSDSGSKRPDKRRKRHQFMYDSEDDPEEDEEGEEDENNFFVNDDEVEHMGTSDADGLLDDDEEAEETDREIRQARREERRQAKAARRLQADQESASEFSSDGSGSDDDTSDTEEGTQNQSTSLTSIATRPADSDQEDGEDGLPTISSRKVRRELQEQARQKKSSSTARERAARAAMTRNYQQTTVPADKSSLNREQNQDETGGTAPTRRKRVIQASDEE